MPTQDEKDATYHCGISKLLKAAYRREFSMWERGRCKINSPHSMNWHATLRDDQRQRVDALLENEYGGSKLSV